MSIEKHKHSECDDMYVYFHQADDSKGEKIMLKWGDLKKEIVEELLSSFPERKTDAPASIDPEFLKPAPRFALPDSGIPQPHLYIVHFVCCKPLIDPSNCVKDTYCCYAFTAIEAARYASVYCKEKGWKYNHTSKIVDVSETSKIVDVSEEARKEKEEPDKPKNAKSTYKVDFICINSCKEGDVKFHTCTACSQEDAIAKTKEYCKTIACDYKLTIGVWRDGIYESAGDLAVQEPQKAKEASPLNTFLVRYEVSTSRTKFDFLSVADSELGAINQLLKDKIASAPAGLIYRIVSVERYDHAKTNH